MEHFRWTIALLDDDLSAEWVGKQTALLDKVNVDVEPFGTFTAIQKGFSRLRRAHIYLLDMQWDGQGGETETFTLDLSDSYQDPDSVFRWLNVLRQWLSSGVRIPSDRPLTAYPRQPIHIDNVGLWLGALLARLQPFSRIVFFSSKKPVWDNPVLEPLKLYPSAVFDVYSKSSGEALPFKELSEHFNRLEREVLLYSAEAYRWFIGSVLLPVLLGEEPAPGSCGPLYATDPVGEWELNAAEFFPQWEDWKERGVRASELPKFLRREPFGVSSAAQRALESVRHKLKGLSDPQEVHARSELRAAEWIAYEIGPAAGALISALRMAIDCPSPRTIREALEACGRVCSNRLRDLHSYCGRLRKNEDGCIAALYCCPDTDMKQPVLPEPLSSEEPELPFDLHHLQRVVDALTANGRDAASKGGETFGFGFWVDDRPGEGILRMTYLDRSPGFGELKELGTKLVNSTHTGLDRGLPLILAFGFHYPLQSLAVKLKGGEWKGVFGEPKLEREVKSDGTFGIEWAFSMAAERLPVLGE